MWCACKRVRRLCYTKSRPKTLRWRHWNLRAGLWEYSTLQRRPFPVIRDALKFRGRKERSSWNTIASSPPISKTLLALPPYRPRSRDSANPQRMKTRARLRRRLATFADIRRYSRIFSTQYGRIELRRATGWKGGEASQLLRQFTAPRKRRNAAPPSEL